MKILVKNIEANPYRAICKYPIDKTKVQELMASFKEVSFWGGLIVRPYPTKKGKYQLAFGHHRIEALKELKIKEIDVKVQSYNDSTMLKMMANENYGWSHLPRVMINTVDSVRKFLNTELAKYETWDEFMAVKFNSHINSAKSFSNIKRDGIGRETILKFLGDLWKTKVNVIGEAIRVLDDENLSREAVNVFPRMYQISRFREAVKSQNVPKAKQKAIAKKLVVAIDEKKTGGRNIPIAVEALNDERLNEEIIDMLDSMDQVDEFRKAVHLADIPKAKQKKIAQTMVNNEISTKGILANVLEQIKLKSKNRPEDPDVVQAKRLIEQIGNEAEALDFKIDKLDFFLQKLNVTELSGLEISIAGMKLEKLKNHILQIERRGQEAKQQKQLVGYNLEI